MRMRRLWMPGIAAVALSGCGPSEAVVDPSALPAMSGPHGGVMVPLTENQASMELLNGKRVLKEKKAEATVEAYLLQADRKTPIAEKPSSVEVKIDTPSGPRTATLKPDGEASDAHFVSDPGPYELEQVGGEVTVQVGGKTLTGKFRGPR